MSKFRIQMARRQGELKAKEMGFNQFPVDPFAIAEAEGIIVEPKAPDQIGRKRRNYFPQRQCRDFLRD